jgi:O-antigen/teichoic acid export membrane protein
MRRLVIGVTAVKATATLSSYAAQYTLILVMTQVAFGRFSLLMSVASIAAMVVVLGHPQVVLRSVAAQIASGISHGIARIWRKSHIWIFAASGLMLVGFWVFGATSQDTALVGQLFWAVAILPVWALLKLNSSLLYGANQTTIAQFAETAIRPFCFFCFVLAVYLSANDLTVAQALCLNFLAFTLAYGLVLIVNLRQKSFQLLHHLDKASNKNSGWFAASLIFSLVSATQLLILNVDLLIIGWMLGDEDVALYRVSIFVALAIGSVEEVASVITRPMVAIAYNSGKLPETLMRIRKLALVGAFLCGVSFSLFWIFGEKFISLMFGEEYASAYIPALILIAGVTISALIGPIGIILNMINHENAHFRVALFSLLINFVLNIVLIPHYGITGAAIASFITILVYRLTAVVLFTRLTGLSFFTRSMQR